MKRTLSPLFTATLALAAFGTVAFGGTAPSKNPVVTPAPEEDHWHFRAAPYGWLTAIDGDVRIGQLSAPVDISMSDTLDSLDMTYMGLIEASYDRWSFGIDGIYGKTSQDIGGGGRVFRSFRYEQKQWLITPTVAYTVIETPGYHMDLVAGGRITVLSADLTGRFVGGGQTTVGRDKSWIDPIVGLRGQADFGDQWFFRYYGDIGGFGAASDLIWQAFAGIGCNCSSNVSIVGGYRAIGIDYDKSQFAMDTVSHGPVLGVEVRW